MRYRHPLDRFPFAGRAERAPGPSGVFVENKRERPRVWHWEGWPANDNLPRTNPLIGDVRADHYYGLLAQGVIER